MHTPLCDELGIEFPIFAFTHCRDVVAAVSKAGGFGVLGAVGFSPEQLEIELAWIDEHVGDRPYGVDIVIPGKYEGMGELDPEKLEADLRGMIPQGHRDFVEQILEDHGVPKLPDEEAPRELLGWTAATATPQVECALRDVVESFPPAFVCVLLAHVIIKGGRLVPNRKSQNTAAFRSSCRWRRLLSGQTILPNWSWPAALPRGCFCPAPSPGTCRSLW